jgi:hypothetical protein
MKPPTSSQETVYSDGLFRRLLDLSRPLEGGGLYAEYKKKKDKTLDE